jgi:CHAT domain-containing protein/tetratricopeptide (TPR) repeat protein
MAMSKRDLSKAIICLIIVITASACAQQRHPVKVVLPGSVECGDTLPATIECGDTLPYAQDEQGNRLYFGIPLKRPLKSDESHHYHIALDKGQYLQATFQNQQINIVATVTDPDGAKIFQAASKDLNGEATHIFLIAEKAGRYLIEVRADDKMAMGNYFAILERLRDPLAEDRAYIEAQKSYLAGLQLLQQGKGADAISKYQEALPLSQAAHDRDLESLLLCSIGSIYSDSGDKQKGLDYCQQALALAQANVDKDREAKSLYAIGNIYLDLAEHQQALDAFNKALEIYDAKQNGEGRALILNSLGIVYLNLSQTEQSLACFNKAAAIYRELGNRVFEAAILNNIGAIYNQQGELRKALDAFNQLLPIYREINDRANEATVLNNLGVIYNSLGEEQQSLDCYKKALAIFEALNDRKNVANTINNIGVIYDTEGEKQQALDCYNKALAVARELGDQDREAGLLNNIGFFYFLVGDYQQAQEYCENALQLDRKLGNLRREAQTLYSIGLICRWTDRFAEALDNFSRSLEISRKIGDRKGEAESLFRVAFISDLQDKDQEARIDYQQALAIEREKGYRSAEALTLNWLGNFYLKVGEKKPAQESLEQALKICEKLNIVTLEADVLYHLARVDYADNDYVNARSRIVKAIDLVESVRKNLASQNLRASFLAFAQDYYKFYIELLMQMHKADAAAGYDVAALQVSERSRARSLLELLAEAHADIRQGVDAGLVERERNLQQRLNQKADLLIKLLSGKFSEAQQQSIENEVNAIASELDQVKAEIRRQSPRYAALTQPEPLDLKAIQQLLDADTLLLEYSLGKERSYLWVVTSASINSYQLADQSKIEATSKRFYELLARRSENGQDQSSQSSADKEEKSIAAQLSKLILSPIADRLGKHRLVIVADGALQYVPFAALALPAANNYRPLITEHEIISLPSASTISLLRAQQAERKPAARSVAVLADPVFENDDDRLKSAAVAPTAANQIADLSALRILQHIADNDGRIFKHQQGDPDRQPHISRLKFTRAEAENIVAIAGPGGYAALDFAASKATINKADLSQYRYIHFATHGYFDSERPEFSALLLSLVDEKGNQQDGFLRANEIFNLNLPAELVVLSACETGLGKEIKGEGLVGLTRGFMYAGAARVVVSLWSINDKATAQLMASFYQKMLKGNESPAAALRAAQIEMWQTRQWQAPFYWAAFQLQGDWR